MQTLHRVCHRRFYRLKADRHKRNGNSRKSSRGFCHSKALNAFYAPESRNRALKSAHVIRDLRRTPFASVSTLANDLLANVFGKINFHFLAIGLREVPGAHGSIHRIIHLASAVPRRRVEA